MQYDYLIVGSGLFGATFAHLAHRAGKRCLVIDKRPQLGGNIYCEQQHGINVHKYGAHIFHTSDKQVWDFVTSLVPFNRYTNCPVALYNGKLYNLPFNMNTFYQMWGVTTPIEATAKIEEQKREAVAAMAAADVTTPRNLEEQALTLVGRDIYETLIKGYTEKQWGRPCSELPAFIIRRLPVRLVYDNNYFNDTWQGIPIGGYNKLTEALLAGIECRTGVDFFEQGRAFWETQAEKIVFTGCIDEFYGYCFGKLQYRTVRFEEEVHNTPNLQGNAVVNYTEREIPWTRIIEHKHFESFGAEVDANPITIISKEFSTEWTEGSEPFYPVNDAANTALADQYRALAEQEQNIIFGGRLAEYKYYDMAPVIASVLSHPEITTLTPHA
ncbi:MAG: UDP-galactopyranose mutase [Akkermansia sp.]|nr:UDP-galactopyranose mutase [Akkermansia sp.]